jgi:O-antigen ligase
MKPQLRTLAILITLLGLAALFLAAERIPHYFTNSTYLGAVLAIEVVIACLWRFDQVFFPVAMGSFLASATGLPFGEQSLTLRWVFLAVGALAGFSIWMRTDRERHFALFHLVALFCVFAAAASASSSSTPTIGALKVASLFLLFLYASTGGRVALAGRERIFLRDLVWACEGMVYLTVTCYLAGYALFGNPNNLGAFIGVIATPILLWAALVAETRGLRQRRYAALGLCGVLLYVSVCRAAIVADGLLMIVLALALRRPRILLRAVFAGALLLEIMAVANPAHMSAFVDSLTGKFVFKLGQTRGGVFGSRQSPWEDTITAVKRHPWFGTGFGTSDVGEMRFGGSLPTIYTLEGTNREHGSSYLALAEYMGMLGILPFLFLLILLARAIARVGGWMRSTGSPNHYAIPFALVCIAGFIHAAFEDWLVAPGSYLCVFFWVCAFLLIDLAPDRKAVVRLPLAEAATPLAFRELRNSPRSI